MPEILIPPFIVGDFLEVGVRAQARHDLRIHALSEGRLVRQIERNASTTGLPAADSAMSYKAIYAYAWDLAEIGRGERGRPLSRRSVSTP